MPKQVCQADQGWSAAYEGDVVSLPCPAGYHGQISRLCMLGGHWAETEDECGRRWTRG